MKLLALVESPDHVCCRYRIRAFAPALNDAGWSVDLRRLGSRLAASSFSTPPGSAVRRGDSAAQTFAGMAIACLAPTCRGISSSISTTRSCFAIPTTGAVPRVAGDRDGLRETVRMADTVVAGNDFLADCALRAGAQVERVHVIPDLRGPAVLSDRAARAGARTISTSSGSVRRARSRGWSSRVRSGNGWRKALPQLEAAGHLRPISGVRFPIPVIPVAWNEQTEAREIAAGHIGVSWLPDDLWSRGKCGLKVLQYQAAGLPVVANPVGSHCEMIRDGETGFLATTPDEWVAADDACWPAMRGCGRRWDCWPGSASRRITRSRPGPRPS